jgi:uncharacterized membrane protein YeaQ/YmgE (transglycosylase-associated protein family)
MNIIVWLVVGGLIGWAAGTLMRTPEGILLNAVVGIRGVVLGRWFSSRPLPATRSRSPLSCPLR